MTLAFLKSCWNCKNFIDPPSEEFPSGLCGNLPENYEELLNKLHEITKYNILIAIICPNFEFTIEEDEETLPDEN